MKTFLKRTCAVIGSAAMLLTCFTGVSFSASATLTEDKDPEFIFSHIEFADTAVEGSDDKYVSAKMFVRDYNVSGDKVSLFCASYNQDGTMHDASVDTGTNALLSTNPVNVQGAEKVRAYIWNADSIEPISDIVKMNSTEAVVPTITFDGKSFKDYVGEDFSAATTTYNVTLKDNYFTKSVKLPDVRVELNDKTAYAEVIRNESPLSDTINIYTGQRTATKSNWGTASDGQIPIDGYTYERPFTSYTINYNYTLPSGIVTADNFPKIQATGNNTGAWDPNGGNSDKRFEKKYVQHVSLDGDTKKTVKVKIASLPSQSGFIVVKPSEGTKHDALVNADGSAITWKQGVSTMTSSKKMVRKGRDENGNDIWADMADGTPVTFTAEGAGASKLTLAVYKETQTGDDKYKTGSAFVSDRVPVEGGFEVYDMADDLVGCNYIVFNSETVSNLELTMTVNCEADIIFLPATKYPIETNAQPVPGEGWTEVADGKKQMYNPYKSGKITGYAAIRYQNVPYVWTCVAAADILGYDKSDFSFVETKEAKVSGTSISGVERYAPIWSVLYEMATLIGNGYVYHPTDAAWAENHKTWASVADVYYKLDGLKLCKGAKMDEPSAVSAPYTKHQLPFEDGERFFADRLFEENETPQTSAAHQGIILKYSDALELENVDLYTPQMGWSNNNVDEHPFAKVYRDKEKASEWFSFTAEEDIEVLLLGKGPVKFAEAENSGWIKVNIKSDDALHVIRSTAAKDNNGNDADYYGKVNVHNNMFIKKYSKGEKVQIYTPQSDAYMAIAVRKLPKKVTVAPEVTVGADSVAFSEYSGTPQDEENSKARYDYVSKNFTDRTGAYAIDNTKATEPAKLGSRVIFNRVYMVNTGYTNDVKSVADSMKFLFGSDYIMNGAGPAEKSGIEFKLYKPATIVVFEDTAPDTAKAAELGWTLERANSNTPFVVAQINNEHKLTNMLYKHYDVEDSAAGVKVEIPNSMIKVNGNDDAVSLAVIYYD